MTKTEPNKEEKKSVESKYCIGQPVFFIAEDIVTQKEVTIIVVYQGNSIKYGFNCNLSFSTEIKSEKLMREDKVFATKKELINSL